MISFARSEITALLVWESLTFTLMTSSWTKLIVFVYKILGSSAVVVDRTQIYSSKGLRAGF